MSWPRADRTVAVSIKDGRYQTFFIQYNTDIFGYNVGNTNTDHFLEIFQNNGYF